MGINKIIYGNTTLIDLTSDTVKKDALVKGYTAHDAGGNIITGTVTSAALVPYYFNLHNGYVASTGGIWRYNTSSQYCVDVYEVKSGHQYFLTLGGNCGNRFVVMITTEDVSKATADITGTAIYTDGTTSAVAYKNTTFTSDIDGYLAVYKDNNGKNDIKTYLYDMTEQWI